MVAEIRRAGCAKALYSADCSGWSPVCTNCAPFWNALRQKRAIIADKFRQGSQLQNYILPLHNISFYSTAKASFSIFIHFLCILCE
ncbi:hypothetical protein [Klebsiella oxytoca]|uniref:hypothetical protein n=1 Tax=Klebsiella oxytoca TaxID=571 RepID=UPI00093ECB55|nr:hypothetical protein [Klebsiella oxytoca]ELG4819878.1 hypothetical protein [Klebsiella oxytoca]ELK5563821.1 hypothetical protein [Klebsiella oxytoca]ELK5573182.1 hypothetical protein [Klebsiella oxytoca]MCY3428613.1 hypothetical protein [Klebsiella oxytoca]MDM4081972.1 hypothetical protein [Klebsiella oxytoca]